MKKKVFLLAIVTLMAVALAFGGCSRMPGQTSDNTQQIPAQTEEAGTSAAEEEPVQETLDVPPPISEEEQLEKQELDDLEIETDHGSIHFPMAWGAKLSADTQETGEASVVSFYAELEDGRHHLFTVTLDSDENDSVGTVSKGDSTFFVHLALEEEDVPAADSDSYYAMQEDINYLIEHLG